MIYEITSEQSLKESWILEKEEFETVTAQRQECLKML
jgi:hypothetical protein